MTSTISTSETRSTTVKSTTSSLSAWALSAVITLLALADAVIHLRLDYVLFNGKFWGSSGFA